MKQRTRRLFCLMMTVALLAGCAAKENHTGISQSSSGSMGQTESSSTSASPESSSSGEQTPLVQEWTTDLPENHGMDAKILEELHAALASTKIHTMLTVKDNVIVDEYYQQGEDKDSVFRFNSCTKSVTSALVGIALDEGLLKSIDESIVTYFPQLAGTDKEKITIRHLLEHKSGLQWDEWTSAGRSFQELNQADNWVEYVLSRPLIATPGTYFTYTTGGTHLLAAILEQVVPETLLDYANERLFNPLGMYDVHWRADPQGILDGGNGLEMTARDAAKFGQLFLDGGRWNGEQLVPAQWVEESTTAQEIRDGNGGSYGYQWWRRTFGTEKYDTFFAMGARGQFIFIVPELNMVTAIASSAGQFTPYPYFTDYILAACKPKA